MDVVKHQTKTRKQTNKSPKESPQVLDYGGSLFLLPTTAPLNLGLLFEKREWKARNRGFLIFRPALFFKLMITFDKL